MAYLVCDPGGSQTHDLQNRNLTLYSLSYRTKNADKIRKNICSILIIRRFLCGKLLKLAGEMELDAFKILLSHL